MYKRQALLFTRPKHGADRVVRHLKGAGIEAFAIHGNKSQAQRTTALQAFRSGQVRLLVATDIAARGIDVSGVSHVINFEIPNVPEQYVHRSGRTARAGAEGVAISFEMCIRDRLSPDIAASASGRQCGAPSPASAGTRYCLLYTSRCV